MKSLSLRPAVVGRPFFLALARLSTAPAIRYDAVRRRGYVTPTTGFPDEARLFPLWTVPWVKNYHNSSILKNISIRRWHRVIPGRAHSPRRQLHRNAGWCRHEVNNTRLY
uniref:Putative secreted protein n=1 Tax=Anopheles marajoara TaxID=58244 RepID=A0A2M4C7X7_9DIPT